MKVLHTAVALVPVAVMVGLQGCGGADGNPGPSADTCVIQTKAEAKDIDCKAISKECCGALNTDAKPENVALATSNSDPAAGKGAGMTDAFKLVGKCGRNDQVGLYNCVKAAAIKKGLTKASPGLKLCTTAPAVGEGADGDGTCKFEAGKGFNLEVPGVSAGCCTAMKTVASMKGAMKGAMKAQGKPSQEEVDKVCGLIGACGRKDQASVLKQGMKMMKGKGKGKGGPAIVDLQAYMPSTELLEYLPPMPMPAFEEFPETEALEEDQSVTEYQSAGMAASGFVAGAAFAGLGLVAFSRRKQTPLEEPLTA